MALSAPPILSTPESHIFEDPTLTSKKNIGGSGARLKDEELWEVYEVERTARQIMNRGWRVVALQFPDSWLGDAGRVVGALEKKLDRLVRADGGEVGEKGDGTEELETNFGALSTTGTPDDGAGKEKDESRRRRHKIYILADTSYGACCVDEIAASHVDAEVVVHYGRSCLSPTARLPVVYVFTSRPLALEPVIDTFEDTYKGKEERILLMSDIIYHSHLPLLHSRLQEKGYKNIIMPEIIHEPASMIPNRKLDISEEELREYSIFHISDPPPALLLTLSSRVRELFIYPTSSPSPETKGEIRTPIKALQQKTSMALRRRYALLTSLSTCSIFGILINTLSVSNYLSTINTIKDMISRAGKKSYTFVVGKVNAAKIANFSEVGGWVVVGCWESSLIESAEFYRPIITPFELGMALMGDGERVWGGEWRGDFAGLDGGEDVHGEVGGEELDGERDHIEGEDIRGGSDSEEESAPPEFDLRTGRYISHSRPMRTTAPSQPTTSPLSSAAEQKGLIKRAKGELATVNGVASPGAEFLRSQRTWVGLGSDFDGVGEGHGDGESGPVEREGANVEEGRRGVARGYVVGEDSERR